MKDKTFKDLIIVLFILGLILRLAFVFLTPPFEVADGMAQFTYAAFIAEENKLPISMGPGTEYYQAPLYYLIYASIIRSADDGFPLTTLRLIDVLMGVLTFFFTFKIASLLFKNKYIILGIVVFAALLPTLAYFNSHITNVNLEIMLSTAGIYLLILALKRESIMLYILIGTVLGLGLLTRASIFLLVIASIFLLILKYYNKKFEFKPFFKALLIVLIFVLLISGWWSYRNLQLYGDFLGVNALKLTQERDDFDRDLGLYARYSGKTFATFWASFGIANNIFLSLDEIRSIDKGFSSLSGMLSFVILYGILFLISLSALIGFVLLIYSHIKRKNIFNTFQFKSLLFLIFYTLLLLVSLFRISFYDYQPQGRFFFQVIVPISAFFVLGINNAAKKFMKQKSIFYFLLILFIVLNILSIIKLVSVDSHVGYLDKIGKGYDIVEADEIIVTGKTGFKPEKIQVASGTAIKFTNHDFASLPGVSNKRPDTIILIFKDNRYLASKTIPNGASYSYRFQEGGTYKIRNGNYGEIQAEVIVKDG